jgi:hypothetical protein
MPNFICPLDKLDRLKKIYKKGKHNYLMQLATWGLFHDFYCDHSISVNS